MKEPLHSKGLSHITLVMRFLSWNNEKMEDETSRLKCLLSSYCENLQ